MKRDPEKSLEWHHEFLKHKKRILKEILRGKPIVQHETVNRKQKRSKAFRRQVAELRRKESARRKREATSAQQEGVSEEMRSGTAVEGGGDNESQAPTEVQVRSE